MLILERYSFPEMCFVGLDFVLKAEWGAGWPGVRGEITSVLLLCHQSVYNSGNTTALHVAVAALKVLGS